MAPIKFEEQIKNKLEERRIEPSSQAWETLANQLEQPEKSKSKALWKYAIAASVIGIMLVSTVFYNNSTSQKTKPIIVNTTNNSVKQNNNNNAVVNGNKNQDEVHATQQNTQVEHKIKQLNKVPKTLNNTSANEAIANLKTQKAEQLKNVLKPKSLNNNLNEDDTIKLTEVTNNSNVAVANNSIKNENVITEKITLKSIEEQKIEDVMQKIKTIEAKGDRITSQEVDKLLKAAENELMIERLKHSNTRTVDANSLLLEVEGDMDKTFRDRVLETLKASYDKVKTAVAERNE